MRRKAHDEKCVGRGYPDPSEDEGDGANDAMFYGTPKPPPRQAGAYESGGKPPFGSAQDKPHSKMTRADFLVGYLSELVFALLGIDQGDAAVSLPEAD